jgi:hypothetical protein
MIPALTTVTVVPFGAYLNEAGKLVPLALANVDVGILAVFAVSSLGVYALILAGWASNSKYPFLGGIRASAQLISYELSMTLSVLPVFLWVNAPGGDGTLSLFRRRLAGQPVWGGLGSCFSCRCRRSSSCRALRRDEPPALRHARVARPTSSAASTPNTAPSSGASSSSPSMRT